MRGVHPTQPRRSLMAPATDFRDAQNLAAAIAAVGGELPPALANLLSAYTVMSAPAVSTHPESAILDAALSGDLTAEKLAKLAPAAASAAATIAYTRTLAQNSAHVLLGQLHRELKTAADQALDGLRSNFDKYAAAIDEARSLFNAESS